MLKYQYLGGSVGASGRLSANAGRCLRTGETYSDEFVQKKIVGFYKYGTGTAEKPGNWVVTEKFCRPYILGVFQAMLSVEASSQLAVTLENTRPCRNQVHFGVLRTDFPTFPP